MKFIQLNNLSLNAQVGVLGHELAHVSTFKNKSFLYFLKLAFNHLFVNSIDKYEYETDYKTIQHRLGYQLLSWSIEVRKNLNFDKWGGSNNPKRERYMNPDTIQKIIDSLIIYQ